MALKYTEEQLNSLDKETLIQLFLSQQEQLDHIDHTLQLVLEQMADLKRHRHSKERLLCTVSQYGEVLVTSLSATAER